MSVWRMETSDDPIAAAMDGKGGHGLNLEIHVVGPIFPSLNAMHAKFTK